MVLWQRVFIKKGGLTLYTSVTTASGIYRTSMSTTKKSSLWKAWLPIPESAPHLNLADVKWFAERGVGGEHLFGALSLLHLIRKRVLPISHGDNFVKSITMLVHAHPKTKKPAIDLTIELDFPVEQDSVRALLKSGWTNVAPAAVTKNVAGVDPKSLKYRQGAPKIVADLTMAYLTTLDAFSPRASDVEVLKQVGQCLHFLTNMSQLTVS